MRPIRSWSSFLRSFRLSRPEAARGSFALGALLWVLSPLVTGSAAEAASYQQIDGTIVDPILDDFGEIHPYVGPNLEPFASLPGVDVSLANLDRADLESADLRGANLSGASLGHASFFAADLSDANLRGFLGGGGNFSGADLSGADFSSESLR